MPALGLTYPAHRHGAAATAVAAPQMNPPYAADNAHVPASGIAIPVPQSAGAVAAAEAQGISAHAAVQPTGSVPNHD